MSPVLDRCVAVLMVALAVAALFVISVLAGCERADESQEAEPAATSTAPRKSFFPDLAELERFRAEGPDPTLRRIAAVDYWLHYRLMQESGIEQELGGEAQAIAALKALGEAYERRARELHEEAPRLIRMAFTGEGMRSGFAGMSLGSFVGLMTGGLTSSAVSRMSDQQLKELSDRGGIRHEGSGGKMEMTFGADGSLTQSTEFDVQEDGLHGKVKMKMHMDACPDADGRVAVEIDVDSQMNVTAKPGTGGFIKSHFRYERWLNDDAKLIDTPDGGASNMRINVGGIENLQGQGADLTVGHDRNGNEFFRNHGEHGFSIFRPEEVERAQEVVRNTELLQSLMAEVLLRGFGGGTPWENGRCVDLQVKSNPAKRSALKPGSRFDIEASPRVKADGSAAGGTVTATLTGGATLQPSEGKVKADAKYAYVGPEEKEKTASIAFEARSKRGVGRASLEFDTKVARAYRIEGGADEFHGTGVVCNLEEQFFVEGSGVTVRFEPSSGQGGRYSYSGKMSGFEVFGHGTYTVNGDADSASGITATGPGSVRTPMGVHTNTGTEQYTLTPLDACPDSG